MLCADEHTQQQSGDKPYCYLNHPKEDGKHEPHPMIDQQADAVCHVLTAMEE